MLHVHILHCTVTCTPSIPCSLTCISLIPRLHGRVCLLYDAHVHVHVCLYEHLRTRLEYYFPGTISSECPHASRPDHPAAPELWVCGVHGGGGRGLCHQDHEHDQAVWQTHSSKQGEIRTGMRMSPLKHTSCKKEFAK